MLQRDAIVKGRQAGMGLEWRWRPKGPNAAECEEENKRGPVCAEVGWIGVVAH